MVSTFVSGYLHSTPKLGQKDCRRKSVALTLVSIGK